MLVRTYRPQPSQHQLHKGKLQKQNLINEWEKRIIRKINYYIFDLLILSFYRILFKVQIILFIGFLFSNFTNLLILVEFYFIWKYFELHPIHCFLFFIQL